MARKLNDEELDDLTPEERAALDDESTDETGEDGEVGEGGDNEPEPPAAAAPAQKETAEPELELEPKKPAAQPDKPAVETPPAAKETAGDPEEQPAGEEEPPAAADTGGDTAPEFAPSRAPRQYVLVQAVNDKLAEIDKKLDKLEDDYEKGELDPVAYKREKRKLDDDRVDYREEGKKTTAAIEEWRGEVAKFMQGKPDYEEGGMLRMALDLKVRELQRSGKYDLFDPVILKAADAAVQADLDKEIQKRTGKTAAKPAAAPAAKAPAAKPAETTIPERPAPPPTLGGLPAAEPEGGDGGEFAWLDRLAESDGERYESELAKLQEKEPDKFNRYMAQG